MHEMLAHNGTEGQMQEMAGYLRCELTRGNIKPCLACTVRKASQKPLSKQQNEQHPNGGKKRMFLDVSALKKFPKDKTVMTNPN